MHEWKSRRFRSDGKSLKSLFGRISPLRVFFYRSRFLLRDNRVLNGLLGNLLSKSFSTRKRLLDLRRRPEQSYPSAIYWHGKPRPTWIHRDGIDVICSCPRNPTKTYVAYNSDFPRILHSTVIYNNFAHGPIIPAVPYLLHYLLCRSLLTSHIDQLRTLRAFCLYH